MGIEELFRKHEKELLELVSAHPEAIVQLVWWSLPGGTDISFVDAYREMTSGTKWEATIPILKKWSMDRGYTDLWNSYDCKNIKPFLRAVFTHGYFEEVLSVQNALRKIGAEQYTLNLETFA